jgi:hypothetical protein
VRISKDVLFEILSIAGATAPFSDHDFKTVNIAGHYRQKQWARATLVLRYPFRIQKHILGGDDESNQ